MSRITLDADLKTKLGGLSEQIELCDADGRTMGHVLPDAAYQKLLYKLAEAQMPPMSPEEIERRRHPTGFKSLAQIWTDLGAK